MSLVVIIVLKLDQAGISLGIVSNCANFVRSRGSQPLLPHLCALSVRLGWGGGIFEKPLKKTIGNNPGYMLY